MGVMRHLTPDQYIRMPWRNGGGTTTELVVDLRLAAAFDQEHLLDLEQHGEHVL